MSSNYSGAVSVTRDYYNSSDADTFYYTIWGGEDIHIGIYLQPEDSIFDASRKTVETMAQKARKITPDTRILDLGAGYGGAARYLAGTYGCHVVALNLSEVENERNRAMNAEQGLSDRIEVVDASFEQVPYADDSFDIVWSQDSILHSGNREQVMAEVKRVLKPEGELIFTDIMQARDCHPGVLQPILDRIHLETLGSLDFYRDAAHRHGLAEVEFEDLSSHLPAHYGRVLKETNRRDGEISKVVSAQYLSRMKKGLQHWIDGGNEGHLQWGILHFRNVDGP